MRHTTMYGRLIAAVYLDEDERFDARVPTRNNRNRHARVSEVRVEVSTGHNGPRVEYSIDGKIILASGHVSTRSTGGYPRVDVRDIPAEVRRQLLTAVKQRLTAMDASLFDLLLDLPEPAGAP